MEVRCKLYSPNELIIKLNELIIKLNELIMPNEFVVKPMLSKGHFCKLMVFNIFRVQISVVR